MRPGIPQPVSALPTPKWPDIIKCLCNAQTELREATILLTDTDQGGRFTLNLEVNLDELVVMQGQLARMLYTVKLIKEIDRRTEI